MEKLHEIMLAILNEIEKKDTILTVAGGKGYSAGKAYPNDAVGVSRLLGKSEYGLEDTDPEEEQYQNEPVKISKAFTKRKKNNG